MSRAMTTPALVLQWLLLWRLAQSHSSPPSINRHREGDMYAPMGTPCAHDSCTGGDGSSPCQCQCPANTPVFRDDTRLCVHDIEECPVAPFVSGVVAQKIPFVFLPLKGQIINPSAEISFHGIATPICAVTSAQFLTKDGWADLQNTTYREPPFRLFRDEGRTFLMWLGEEDLWVRMEGRLILVRLMCRDGSLEQGQSMFTPCVAFRVAGTPSIRGVVFESPALAQSSGLTVSEYVAIAVCSVLLGLIYVASVFLFLYLRRRRKGRNSKSTSEDGTCEQPVVKSNPLLGLRRHQRLMSTNNDTTSYVHSDSASCCSDTDDLSDSAVTSDDGGRVTHKVTSAMVHTCSAPDLGPPLMQESSSIERLPEENVSIVETESREEQPDTVKAITCGTTRRKLYFNPAYFEPELLADPPPAAIEFLIKIREVISIAKHKMSAKRFSPSLVGIPEEEPPPTFSVSLKRENSRKKDCASCSTCATDLPLLLAQPLPDFPACRACCSSESKKLSIRKWLEDVPDVKSQPPPPRVKKKAPPLPDDSHKRSPPIQRPKESPPKPPPTPVLPPAKNTETDNVVAPVRTKLMDAVIKEMVVQRGLEGNKEPEYEADSLERTASMQKGLSTPTDYGDVQHSQTSSKTSKITPTENNICNGFNNGKLQLHSSMDEHDYEAIMPIMSTCGSDTTNNELKLLTLPEILSTVGYNLVSEVYVNDGYNSVSSPSNSSNSSPSGPRIRYDEPGHLTIHVEDSPDNYRQSPDDSDSFEPDTLDRKPIKIKPEVEEKTAAEIYADSLERPVQILLRTTGSFRSDSLAQSNDLPEMYTASPLHRKFGSLREIYETKFRRMNGMDDTCSIVGSTRSFRSDTEHYITSWRRGKTADPDDRLARRQRRPSPPLIYQNEVAPPLPPKTRCPYYEDPPPPRPAYQKEPTPPLPPKNPKPPLPPKNGADRSIRHERMVQQSESSARRQPASLPHHESYGGESTLSSATTASPDSLSSGSGASVDSLNTSDGGGGDYEELCVMPQSDLVKRANLNGQFILKAPTGQSNNSLHNVDNIRGARQKVPKDLLRHMRDRQGIESVKKNWRRIVARVGTKPEDSGYLSTDSNESLRHRRNNSRPASVSETDESLCDGASESGAESIATDSFFFGGNFRKASTCGVIAESVDSGVGSELVGLVGRSHEATVEDTSSDSENVSFVTVLPPGSGRRSALRC